MADADLPEAAFDRILAINVNVFWTNPSRPYLDRIRGALKKGGRLVLAFEGVPGGDTSLRAKARDLTSALGRHHFTEIKTRLVPPQPRPHLLLIASR